MSQPPPYPGGYPQQPDPYANNGYGQPTPPPPPPPGQPGGFNQQPGGFGQQPGTNASGFPTNPQAGGPVPPPPSGGKKVGKAIGSVIVVILVLVLIFGGKFLLRLLIDDGIDHATGSTDIAEVGDCTTKSAHDATQITDNDASDVKVVDCSDSSAYFKVVKRDDSPTETDAKKAGDALCQGTSATEYIYMEKDSGSLDWLICIDPIHIKTAKYGEIPGKVGQCWSDNQSYYEIVDCTDSKAKYKIVTAEDHPTTTSNDPKSASGEVCSKDAQSYFSEPQDAGPFDWFICTANVS